MKMFPALNLPRKMTPNKLYDHQLSVISQLKTGSILCGGVGSGKSLTSLYYFYTKECNGYLYDGEMGPMLNPKDLFIITTARKRDSFEWERECAAFMISSDRSCSYNNIKLTTDSWNNIGKYKDVKDAFFIFDEQRVVGSGSWVKSFLKITKNNNWLLLSATPGDTWMDYIPAFIANGFYKNRTEFLRTHVVYNTFTKYPKVDHYVECGRLIRLRNDITVNMSYLKSTTAHPKNITVPFDKEKFDTVAIKRWNPYENRPVKDIGELCHVMRKVVNSDTRRLDAIKEIFKEHDKLIVFYNFNYELDLLKQLKDILVVDVAEYNGHKHEPIPKADKWIYLVQYISGAEGWNCIETNAILFYSQNYSYRIMTQAAGRIDRINTPFSDLYYYTLRSLSMIDMAIAKAIHNKKDFNESKFVNF